jgi:hypothetical protein
MKKCSWEKHNSSAQQQMRRTGADRQAERDMPSRPDDDQFWAALKNEGIAGMDADSNWRAQRNATAPLFLAPRRTRLLGGNLRNISQAK